MSFSYKYTYKFKLHAAEGVISKMRIRVARCMDFPTIK